MPTEDLTDFDLAEMDPYAITPDERAIIDHGIEHERPPLSTDAQISVFVAGATRAEIVRQAGHDRLLAKRLLAALAERELSQTDRELIVELRAIVTDPAST